MEYILHNDVLQITVRSHGAEIRSLTETSDGTEYLHNGDPAWWKYSSPVLFPIVGKLWEGKYRVQGQEYELPSHGLGRISEFELVNKGDDSIEFTLGWTQESLKNYPWKFRLNIGYRLEKNAVKVMWKVQNEDNSPLPFSIGAHPALRCPIVGGEDITDCYLEFNQAERATKFDTTPDTFLYDKQVPGISGKELPLTWDFFAQGTWIFDNLQSDRITIRSRKSQKSVAVEFTGFPFLALWSPEKGGAPFICIEPWYGHADMAGYTGEFAERHGTNIIKPGEEFNASYRLIVGE